jgi:ankyrin repeat protein
VNTVAGGPEGHGTALIAASAAGWPKVVQFLLEKGAKIDLEAGKYRTALIAASAMGEIETAKLLLLRGANVHTQVSNGEYDCALSAALQSNTASVEMMQLLRLWM